MGLYLFFFLDIFYMGIVMIKIIIKLLLIVLWMGLIFSFSSDTGKVSTKKSDGFIIRIIETISRKDLSDKEKEMWIDYLVVPVRKSAHVGVYFILGILIISFISEFMDINYKSILISIGITLLYACSDELHQLLVVGRSGEIKDVFLDVVGGSAGIWIYCWFIKFFKKKY